MKKLLGYIVLSLLWCSFASAKIVYLKCYWKTRYFKSVAENPLDKWTKAENVNSDKPGYVAFDKSFVYYNYDPINRNFNVKVPISSYGETRITFFDSADDVEDLIDRKNGIIFFETNLTVSGHHCDKIKKKELPKKSKPKTKF